MTGFVLAKGLIRCHGIRVQLSAYIVDDRIESVRTRVAVIFRSPHSVEAAELIQRLLNRSLY
jgi:hypothetical protein